MPHPLQMPYGNHSQLGKRSNALIRSRSVIEVRQFQAKEKYRGVFEIQKSGDKTSSGEIGLDMSFSIMSRSLLSTASSIRCCLALPQRCFEQRTIVASGNALVMEMTKSPSSSLPKTCLRAVCVS